MLCPSDDDDEEFEELRRGALLSVLGDRAVSKQEQSKQKSDCEGLSAANSPNEGMVRGDKAEAARGNLMDPLLAQAGKKKNKGELRLTVL